MATPINLVKFICKDCGLIWNEDYEDGVNCPKCHSENIEEVNRTRY